MTKREAISVTALVIVTGACAFYAGQHWNQYQLQRDIIRERDQLKADLQAGRINDMEEFIERSRKLRDVSLGIE